MAFRTTRIFLVLFLACMSAPVSAQNLTNTMVNGNTTQYANQTYEVNGFLISVHETMATVQIQVQSKTPYGVFFQSSQNTMTHPDFKNVWKLTAAFDVAPSLQLQQGVNASTPYTKVMRKQNLDQVVLTIKSGAFNIMTEQVVWQRPQQQQQAPEAPAE